MFYHLVMVRFTDGADATFHQRIHDYCDEMQAKVPSVRQYSYCANLVPGGFTHSIVGVYDSIEDYNAYWHTQLHDDLKAYMTQFVAQRMVCDFDTSLRRLYYDAVLYNKESLSLLFELVGTDRCMFGTENPGSGTATDPITGLQLDDTAPVIKSIEWLSEQDINNIFGDVQRKVFPRLKA